MRRETLALAGLAVVLGVVIAGPVARGHAPIASRYTYNDHLFPIFRDHCGVCHIEGGIAPMSLLIYKEAYPWAQSIREEVLALRMPPWHAEDGFGSFQNGHTLPAAEMDMILEWSSGGYPQGPLDRVPEPPVLANGWSLGEPELALSMTSEYAIDAATSEDMRFFVIPTGLTADRWLEAVDFRPGSSAIVRAATVYVDAAGTARERDQADEIPGFAEPDDAAFPPSQPVAVWIPGQSPVVLSGGAGYRLPAGADLVLRVHYKKTWITEGEAFVDRSVVGLYFTDGPAQRPVQSLVVTSPTEEISGSGETTFRQTLEMGMDLLAVLPEIDVPAESVRVEAVRPDGSRAPVLLLREPDPGWPTRYWFETPLSLPEGSQLEVTTTSRPGSTSSSSSLIAGLSTDEAPIRLLLDFVPEGGTADGNGAAP